MTVKGMIPSIPFINSIGLADVCLQNIFTEIEKITKIELMEFSDRIFVREFNEETGKFENNSLADLSKGKRDAWISEWIGEGRVIE